MHLLPLLPAVDPGATPTPTACPAPGCASPHLTLHQVVPKPVRDTLVEQVVAHRDRGVRCGHTCRVSPPGVGPRQTAARRRGLGVLRSLLGLSSGAVALALAARGHPLSKVAVSHAVPAAGQRVAGRRREAGRWPRGQRVVAAGGADLTSVKGRGKGLTVGAC